MKKVFFTAGPSQLYSTVQEHIKNALRDDILSISHRSKLFIEIFRTTTENLRSLMGIPKDHHVFFLGSATEGMERILENTVEEHSLHFVNGAFSKKFFRIAEQLGKNAKKFEADAGKGFDVREIQIPAETECICVTQNETSTGVSFPMSDIYTLKKRNKNSLLAVDVVSSAPYVNIDFNKVDLVFFSVQKGFGMPAGLGVLIVGPKAFEKAKFLFEKGVRIGSYHNFLVMEEYSRKYQTHDTPNVLGIYLLGKVCEDMLKKGIGTIRKETEEKANMIYTFFEKHEDYKLFVKDKKNRSLTMIVIETKEEVKSLLSKLSDAGFIVSSGYGAFKESQIRIANYPSTSVEDMKNLIAYFTKF